MISVTRFMCLFFTATAVFLSVSLAAAGSSWPTMGGEGGRIITVTNLGETGTGTLRAALETGEPCIIRFAVAGEIWINDVLRIRHPYVTVEGASAPSPGITIIGDCVSIRTHDVIIRDIRVRTGARSVGSDPSNRDCLQINGSIDGTDPSYNVLIENCSFAWAIDESVQMWGKGSHDIVVRRCIIAETLKNSIHAKGDHSAGLLVGPGVTNVLVEQNLFAHNSFRNPVVASGLFAVVANNLIYNPGFNAFHIYGHEGYGPTSVDVIGNVIIAGPDTRPVLGIFHNRTGLAPGSQVYLDDNIANGTESFNPDERPENWADKNLTPFSPTSVVRWSALQIFLPSARVEATVLANAGARINDRDVTDARILNEVKTRTGSIRNLPDDKRLHPDPNIKDPKWTTKSNDAPPVR